MRKSAVLMRKSNMLKIMNFANSQGKRYQFDDIRSPKLVYSLRRHRHEGRFNSIRRNMLAALYILTKGPITKEIFTYQMEEGSI